MRRTPAGADGVRGQLEKAGKSVRFVIINGQGYRVNGPAVSPMPAANCSRLLKSGDDGQHVAPDKVTLTQWVTDWLALRFSGKIAARSHERYEQLLRLHVLPSLGARRLQAISPKDIDNTVYATIAAKGLSERTAHYVHAAFIGVPQGRACGRSSPAQSHERMRQHRRVAPRAQRSIRNS